MSPLKLADVLLGHRLKGTEEDGLTCTCGYGHEQDWQAPGYDWDTPEEHIAKVALKAAGLGVE